MNITKCKKAIIFLILAGFYIFNPLHAQEKKVATPTLELYNTIASMDSIMFAAFNTQNMHIFKSLFTTDLEWYQDNGGLISYQKVFENFNSNFKKEHKLSRHLIKGSLEVYPIGNYGALEIGTHQFKHIENGKQETGTFKFVMIWQKKDTQWKISRVISYGH